MRRVATALTLIALAAVTALAGVDSGGGHSLAAAQATTDYDDDDDRLIDVRTLGQLNAMRWDLNGNGEPDSMTRTSDYAAAFPNRDTAAATRMGCPSPGCKGYELRVDLDFDTDGDGDVDAQDSPSFPNWSPIGLSYSAEFHGNSYTISNLTINRGDRFIGLFDILGPSSLVTGVGLVDADITASVSRQGIIGALVGFSRGTIRSSYSTGSVTITSTGGTTADAQSVGGLAGYMNGGSIASSWSAANLSVAKSGSYAGGLVGRIIAGSITASYATGAVSASGTFSKVGGLVGGLEAAGIEVSASYATGAVSSTGSGSATSGLIGRIAASGIIVSASYWDVGTTGIADDANNTAPEGVATSDLQSITSYTGVFADWNVNVDGQTGADNPWNFGTAMQYPRLQFGFDAGGQVAQGSLVMGTPGTNGDNPVVGQTARVCLLDGPTQRAAGTGGRTYAPWQWYRSTDGVNWGSPITKTGPTYDYMPVAGDAGNYLRACVDVVSTTGAERVLGADRVCVGAVRQGAGELGRGGWGSAGRVCGGGWGWRG